MGCGVYWSQVKELDRALRSLRKLGIGELDPSYGALSGLRSKLLAQVGIKFPRTVTQIAKLFGLSPGIITLWHDVESGWMSEARTKPGAPPVYRAISDEVAVAIIKSELTHDQFMSLSIPDDYIGE